MINESYINFSTLEHKLYFIFALKENYIIFNH